MNIMPSHMPSFDEPGFGRIEYDTVSGSTTSDLADLSPAKEEGKGESILNTHHNNVPTS